MAARKQTGAKTTATAIEVVYPAQDESSLEVWERVIEDNVTRGAGYWRIAADALRAIKEQRLWKMATDEGGKPYKSFVVYAEARFGFKKTYAYDLVKAATRKPEAVTEGEAREAIKKERPVKSLSGREAAERMSASYDRLESHWCNLRDRTLDGSDPGFAGAFDEMRGVVFEVVASFVEKWTMVVEGTVSPTREHEEGENDATLPS